MVYFPTSPEQCFALGLPCKRKIQISHIFTEFYMIMVENGRCWTFFRWSWGKSQWHVLPGCFSIAANVSAIRHILRVTIYVFSAAQHTCASGPWDNRTPAAWNTLFHDPSRLDLNPVDYRTRFGESRSSMRSFCVGPLRDADPQCRRTQAATGWRLEQII